MDRSRAPIRRGAGPGLLPVQVRTHPGRDWALESRSAGQMEGNNRTGGVLHSGAPQRRRNGSLNNGNSVRTRERSGGSAGPKLGSTMNGNQDWAGWDRPSSPATRGSFGNGSFNNSNPSATPLEPPVDRRGRVRLARNGTRTGAGSIGRRRRPRRGDLRYTAHQQQIRLGGGMLQWIAGLKFVPQGSGTRIGQP